MFAFIKRSCALMWNKVPIKMEDYPEWKPVKVKLESELILDDAINVDSSLHDFVQNSVSAIMEHISSVNKNETSLMTKIKEEITEDQILSADAVLDADNQNSTETRPIHRNEDIKFFQEKKSIKLEDDIEEKNDTSKSNGFTKASKDFKIEGMSCKTTECPASRDNKECTAPQSGWTPFEFVDTSVTIKKHVARYRKMPFPCTQCVAQFRIKSALQKHLRTHSAEGAFWCGKCSGRFNNHAALKYHSQIHTNEKGFKCTQCSAQFQRKNHFQDHLEIHSGKRDFSCPKCSDQFKLKQHLNIHLLKHSKKKENLFCDQCSVRFTHKHHLESHLLTHGKKKAFSCDRCPAQFENVLTFRSHLLGHSSQKAFSCDKCSAKFYDKASLQKHLLFHSEKKMYSCHHCSAQYTRKGFLEKHLLLHR